MKNDKVISEELQKTLPHKTRSSYETTAILRAFAAGRHYHHKNTVCPCRSVGSDNLLTSSSEPIKSINLFLAFAEERDLKIGNEFLEKILEFCELILEENKKQNLVSKNDEGKLLTRHIADSLVFATPTPTPQTNWADIGSGAGFPVVPLALYFPGVNFFAVENRRLRCEFLNEIKRKLNIENLQIVKSSAESSGLQNMDFVSCRAVGSLSEDFNRAKSILKKTGHFLTLKSKRTIDELREKNDPLLSAAVVEFYKLPLEENEYALVIFD